MLVVVAGAQDVGARRLPERWAPHDVAVLTPGDLATVGWRWRPAAPEQSAAVLDGRLVALTDISGVLVRLPAVTPRELPQISAAERDYVAAEMTAFLVAVLGSLDCVVLNPPASPFLTSPLWRRERWMRAAARLGIPTAGPASRRTDMSAVTVVGDRCFGAREGELRRQSRLLARACGAAMVVARFVATPVGRRLAGADPWADLEDDDVAAALLAHLA